MSDADRVKAAARLEDVVSRYVRLKRGQGGRMVGLCPFHSEKSPSFGVHQSGRFFKCFGCGKGGDVIDFLSEIEGLTFPEALRQLAEENHVTLDEKPGPSQRRAIMAKVETAVENFRSSLPEDVREYLAARGITPESVETFGIGYSSADPYRDRLIFPLYDEQGRPVAVAGRALREGQQPKYLNSPSSDAYDKSRTLYNLHRAKEAIRRTGRAVVVEGYTDVIAAWQAGERAVIASCGTALTEHHAKLLHRHADRVVICFDPDGAGATAAEKGAEKLLAEGLQGIARPRSGRA